MSGISGLIKREGEHDPCFVREYKDKVFIYKPGATCRGQHICHYLGFGLPASRTSRTVVSNLC
jgi:hypothetical protein